MSTVKTLPGQQPLDFTWGDQVENYVKAKLDIEQAISETQPAPRAAVENEFELCVELAAAIKKAIRVSGLSRAQVVDEVNTYFCRTEDGAAADPPECRKPLTIHMLNNYLSKPADYPIPAYYLPAFHRITNSLAPAAAIVAMEGAKVATGEELTQMALGKLEQSITDMNRLKRTLKKGGL